MIRFDKFVLSDYADCLVVTDQTLQRLYNIYGDNVFVLPCGEVAKSFEYVQKICSWFLSKQLPRDGKVVAVGGGSVGDVVGFAASIYKRGVNVLQVPTTLLAMVDSGIGGKTAIDLDGVKNAVGTFCQCDTLVDVDFLSTLDNEQLNSGLGEIVKYKMLDKEIADSTELSQTIRLCCFFKQKVCQQDFFDQGARRMLNMGHTLGHALELTYGIPHGVAVANGLYYELQLAHQLHICTYEHMHKWQSEIESHFSLYNVTQNALQLTLNDKKNANDGKITFVLPMDDGWKQVPLSLEFITETLCKQ